MLKTLAAHRRTIATTFALIILCAGLIALSPTFPAGIALDNAWIMGLHEASARSLAYGRDMIFTFGPYAAIYTHEYHAATDHIMLFGSIFVTAGFVASVLVVARRTPWYWSTLFAYVVCVLSYSRDAQLFAFAPLAVMASASVVEFPSRSVLGQNLLRFSLLVTGAVLGILPLIKGSLLAPVLVAVTLSTALIAKRISLRFAALYAISPLVSLVISWLISGQALGNLPAYFSTQLQIISGYTDAMSSIGPTSEWVLYLFGSLLCLFLFASAKILDKTASRAVLIMLGVFFFIAFKAGFVRHDGHAVTAASALLIGIMLVSTCLESTRFRAAILGALVCWIGLDGNYSNVSTKQLLVRTSSMFEGFVSGLRARALDSTTFNASYSSQLSKLAEQCSLPKLDGTTDIYSYGQTCLIATQNSWSPRPIFQSYSAYTSDLAEINRQHLMGLTAPDHVLFRVEPIDGRLPSLEDGYSWPTLLNRYVLKGFQNDYLQFDKRSQPSHTSSHELTLIKTVSAQLGQPIEVPRKSGALIFASVSVRPTILGKIASVLFKPPQLQIRVGLANGSFKEYRYVARMAEKPIMISPLVDTTRDFYLLANGSSAFIDGNRVTSIQIAPRGGTSLAWSDAIDVQYFSIPSPPQSNAAAGAFDRPVIAWGGPTISRTGDDWQGCDGSIDSLNGVSPAPMTQSAGAILSVDGWAAGSAQRGELADAVYVALIPKQDKAPVFVKARATDRSDVARYFNQPAIRMSGFSAYIDTSNLQGEYALSIVQQLGSRYIPCRPLRVIRFIQD